MSTLLNSQIFGFLHLVVITFFSFKLGWVELQEENNGCVNGNRKRAWVLLFAEMSRCIRQYSVCMLRGWSGAVEMWEADSVSPILLPKSKRSFLVLFQIPLHFDYSSWFNRPHFHSLPSVFEYNSQDQLKGFSLFVCSPSSLDSLPLKGWVIDIVMYNNGIV